MKTLKNIEDFAPAYKKMNIKPKEFPSNNSAQFVVSKGSRVNPRERVAPQTRVPFAEIVIDDKFPIGTGPVPNIGNNIEHTWSGVNAEIIDDLGLDPNHPMIDNNEYMDLGEEEEDLAETKEIEEILHGEEVSQQSFVDTKKLEEYSLVIFGEFYSSGSLEEIEKEVQDLLYNQHPLSRHVDITLDDITVLKKMNIKFGVFIREE